MLPAYRFTKSGHLAPTGWPLHPQTNGLARRFDNRKDLLQNPWIFQFWRCLSKATLKNLFKCSQLTCANVKTLCAANFKTWLTQGVRECMATRCQLGRLIPEVIAQVAQTCQMCQVNSNQTSLRHFGAGHRDFLVPKTGELQLRYAEILLEVPT